MAAAFSSRLILCRHSKLFTQFNDKREQAPNNELIRNGGLTFRLRAPPSYRLSELLCKAERNISLFVGPGLNNSLLSSVEMVDLTIKNLHSSHWFEKVGSYMGWEKDAFLGGKTTGSCLGYSWRELISFPPIFEHCPLGNPSPSLPGQLLRSMDKVKLPCSLQAHAASAVFKGWHEWAHWQNYLLVRFSKHL